MELTEEINKFLGFMLIFLVVCLYENVLYSELQIDPK